MLLKFKHYNYNHLSAPTNTDGQIIHDDFALSLRNAQAYKHESHLPSALSELKLVVG